MEDSDFNTHSELCRKTFEEMTRIWENYQTGKVTLAQVQASLLTLWNITSGLIKDVDYESMLAALGAEVNSVITSRNGNQPSEFMLFRRDDSTILVLRSPSGEHRGRFTLLKVIEVDVSDREFPPSELDASRKKIIDMLTGRGMRLASYC